MLLLVLANLFAPLSAVKDGNNNKIIQTNIAEALVVEGTPVCATNTAFCVTVKDIKVYGTGITGNIEITTAENKNWLVVIRVLDPNTGKYILGHTLLNRPEWILGEDNKYKQIAHTSKGKDYDSFILTGLEKNKSYNLLLDAILVKVDATPYVNPKGNKFPLILANNPDVDPFYQNSLLDFKDLVDTEYVIDNVNTAKISDTLVFQTNEKTGEGPTKVDETLGGASVAGSADNIMPGCAITGDDGTVMGCLVQGFYYMVFVPTSFLFALGGKFFDFAFKYSIQDSSYRTGFVIEGWKIVRDLCNIFFIFVILTAAIKMILNIGHGAKDAIINVVIIGLLINFSLFATQVIIDSSNILARLFYNSESITIAVTGGKAATRAGISLNTNSDTTDLTNSTTDEISLSAALVDKVDPQAIILNAKNINVQERLDENALSAEGSTSSNDGIGVGAFFLITLLSSIVNLLGFFVFLSIALIFIGRVVGLWFAMVFVPFAFFSYTMPGMLDDVEMFGWKKWWPETLKLAFMAPIFMFFMYLIILFLSKGFMDLFDADAHGTEFILQTIIPFAVIMTLMWKAKSIATSMAGTTAGMVAKGVAAAGGGALALTGAGIAMGGRSIGRMTARAANGETSTQRYAAARKDPTLMKDMNWKDKTLGRLGSKIKLDNAFGNKKDASGNIDNGIGGIINKAQKKVAHSDHAKSEMDGFMKDAHLEGLDPKDMTGIQAAEVKKKFDEKKKAVIVTEVKEGKVKDSAGNNVKSENDYSIAKRKEIEDKIREDAEIAYRSKNNLVAGPVTRAEQDAIDKESDKAVKNAKSDTNDRVQQGYRKEVLEGAVKVELDKKFNTLKEDAKHKVSTSDRLVSQANTGSWNPGNISAMAAMKNDAISSKMLFGISAAIAMGMRGGLKSVVGVNPGAVSKDFATDIKNAFSEALKSANFKVDIKAPAAHGGGGHDDHGHGGGGGHH